MNHSNSSNFNDTDQENFNPNYDLREKDAMARNLFK